MGEETTVNYLRKAHRRRTLGIEFEAGDGRVLKYTLREPSAKWGRVDQPQIVEECGTSIREMTSLTAKLKELMPRADAKEDAAKAEADAAMAEMMPMLEKLAQVNARLLWEFYQRFSIPAEGMPKWIDVYASVEAMEDDLSQETLNDLRAFQSEVSGEEDEVELGEGDEESQADPESLFRPGQRTAGGSSAPDAEDRAELGSGVGPDGIAV